MPRYDNMFGGGNYDSDDFDDWLTIQRDWQVDAGIEPLDEAAALEVRERAARAIQSAFDVLGFPPITEEEVRLATTCVDSRDLPDRDRPADVAAADQMLAHGITALDVARALDERGFSDVAAAIFEMQRRRVAADYLQTSAIVTPDGDVAAAINDPNVYDGPGTGYRLDGERWKRLQRLPHVVDARLLGATASGEAAALETLGEASPGTRRDEVVVAVGPAYGGMLMETINGLAHADVVAGLVAGIEEGGAAARLVRVRRSSDVAFIGHDGARLSGSGVAVGVQSKGTALIHRSELEPLDNLELFGMAPSLTLESYRQIGRNAAAYALGRQVAPVPTVLDNFARAKLIVRTTLMHARETAEVVNRGTPLEVRLVGAPIPA
jgi:propanediol dehydratase large subunit